MTWPALAGYQQARIVFCTEQCRSEYRMRAGGESLTFTDSPEPWSTDSHGHRYDANRCWQCRTHITPEGTA